MASDLAKKSAHVSALIANLRKELRAIGLDSNMLNQLEQQLLRRLRS